MFRRIARAIGRTFSPPVKVKRPKARLWLESLEARDVPATFVWYGGDAIDPTSAKVAYNWRSDTLPGPNDDLVYAPQFDYGGGMCGTPTLASVPCTGLDGTYLSLTAAADYSAKITLDGPLTLGSLFMYGGTIDQPAIYGEGDPTTATSEDNSDITVTHSFEWTGGTINSTDHPANLILRPGGGGVIEPLVYDAATGQYQRDPDTGDYVPGGVTTKSTMKVAHAVDDFGNPLPTETTISFLPGTVTFAGASTGMEVNEATVNIIAGPDNKNTTLDTPLEGTNGSFGPKIITLGDGGNYHVIKLFPWIAVGEHYTRMPILNNGGMINIDQGIHVGVQDLDNSGLGASIKQTSGSFSFSGGSGLVVANGVRLEGGVLRAGIRSDDLKARIFGNLVNAGATIEFGGIHRGQLEINGDANWISGDYQPWLDGANSPDSAYMAVTGTLTIGVNTAIDPIFTNAPETAAGRTWIIFSAGTFDAPVYPAMSLASAARFMIVPYPLLQQWRWAER